MKERKTSIKIYHKDIQLIQKITKGDGKLERLTYSDIIHLILHKYGVEKLKDYKESAIIGYLDKDAIIDRLRKQINVLTDTNLILENKLLQLTVIKPSENSNYDSSFVVIDKRFIKGNLYLVLLNKNDGSVSTRKITSEDFKVKLNMEEKQNG